jgi:hypothetical protein
MKYFLCQHCGSTGLGYQKYVKCIIPISLENRDIEYGLSIVDEDNYLAVSCGFSCMSCGRLVEHCGRTFETERDLIAYLSAPEYQISEERQLYNANTMERSMSDGYYELAEDEVQEDVDA